MGSLLLVDTSVAVALLVEDHVAHETCRAALADQDLGLAGHAIFETMSVLSRMPAPQRRSVRVIHEAIEYSFPRTRFLSEEGTRSAAASMGRLGIGGGAVYDALVAAAAIEQGLPLVSRDLRAVPTYRAMGVQILLIG